MSCYFTVQDEATRHYRRFNAVQESWRFLLPPARRCEIPCDISPHNINPLNAEFNPFCYLLVLLGDLTFMGPCIIRIFQYTSNKMQRYTVYYILKMLYMFRVVLPPIIRSAYNCIYSIWYNGIGYVSVQRTQQSWLYYKSL
jgi:hypothetical protein